MTGWELFYAVCVGIAFTATCVAIGITVFTVWERKS